MAIVLGEPDAPKYAESMAAERSSGLYISAANYMECRIVVDAKAEKSENPVKTAQPLLWKGDDFTHTGIESALDR